MKTCQKRHDDFFKVQFLGGKGEDKVFYQKDFLEETLEVFEKQVNNVDTKVKKIKEKQDNKLYRGEISSEYQEKIDLIDLEIKRLLRVCENFGDEGEIEEMEKKMEEIEKLREDKDAILSIAENPLLAQKQMKLCEVCGAMQSINDMEKRNLTHLDGKLHIGFAKMRKEIVKMKKRYESILLEIEVIKERRKRSSRGDYRKRRRRDTDDRMHHDKTARRIKKDKKKSKKSKKKNKRRAFSSSRERSFSRT